MAITKSESKSNSSKSNLSPSELILNPDGSIYHLNLHPEQVAKTIITVGDPERVKHVSKYFDSIQHQTAKREFVCHTGYLNAKRITVISTGISTDNIDIVLNELDALFNIDFKTRTLKEELTQLDFIRIGTSGSMQEDLEVDDSLISSYAIGLDNLLHYYDYKQSEVELKMTLEFEAFFNQIVDLLVTPYIFEADNPLLEKIGGEMKRGITVTCPGFYGPQGRQLRLKSIINQKFIEGASKFDIDGLKLTNFEMETAGIYGLAKIMGHRAVSCNAILVNRVTNKFSNNPNKVVDRMVRKILEKITSF